MARRITRNVYLLGFLSFFNDITADMITPLLPAFLGTLGVGAAFLGIMEGAATSVSYLVMLFSGNLADRIGKNKALTIGGYGLSSFIRPLLAIPVPIVTLITRLLDRTGKGIRTAPRDKLVTASVNKAYWGEAFGIQRALDHAGTLIGAPLAAWLLAAYSLNFSYLFLIASVPAILSVLFLAPRIEEKRAAPSAAKPRMNWRTLPDPLKRYFFVILVSALGTPSELFLILRMQKLGLRNFQMPLAWFLLTLFTFGAAYVGGPLGDRWSRRRTMGLGWLIFVLVHVAFAFNTNLGWSWVLIALFGLQAGLVEGAERAYSATLASEGTRATALGWYYFSYGLGTLPASILFGALWKFWNPTVAFLTSAGLTFLAVGLLFILPTDRPERARELPGGTMERD